MNRQNLDMNEINYNIQNIKSKSETLMKYSKVYMYISLISFVAILRYIYKASDALENI